MDKQKLIQISNETVSICNKKEYCFNAKRIALQKDFESELINNHSCPFLKEEKEGEIIFVKESVIDTISKLKNCRNITVLNFASAKNPGGGFLNGSVTQEECLARCSNMYPSLIKHQKEFYEVNKKNNNPLYTDNMIFSKNISVFRNNNYDFLEEPILINIITSPAVNAGVARNHGISNRDINNAMENRIRKIIQLAATKETDYLVLGAFGCGVFKNKNEDISHIFFKILVEENMKKYFKKIIFPIYDKQEIFNIFKNNFK